MSELKVLSDTTLQILNLLELNKTFRQYLSSLKCTTQFNKFILWSYISIYNSKLSFSCNQINYSSYIKKLMVEKLYETSFTIDFTASTNFKHSSYIASFLVWRATFFLQGILSIITSTSNARHFHNVNTT